MNRLALSVAFALMLGGCASYDSNYAGGYYAPGHDGYGDYYYDNPQVIVDEYYAPYWGWGGYFPYDGFGFQPGFGSGWYGGYPYGYYDPWSFYGWYDYRYQHRHGNDGDKDADDAPGTASIGQHSAMTATNPQSTSPWLRRWNAAALPRVDYRQLPRSPDAQRNVLPYEQRRGSIAPVSRAEAPHRHRDTDWGSR